MKRISLFLILLAVILIAVPLEAGRREHDTKSFEIGEATQLSISGEFGAGEFYIETADMDEAAKIDVYYDDRDVGYDADYRVRSKVGYLDLESYTRRRNNHNLATEDHRWEIVLSTKYPAELDLKIGACKADFELGGIPLTDLNLEVGAASGTVVFSKKNPKRLEEINVDAGASSLEMKSIGNANFERFEFDGGVGSFDLDFTGEYEGQSEIYIDIGMGSADIYLPHDIPVRIESGDGSLFSSIDIHGGDLDEVDDDIYESKSYDRADTRILLSIDVGMGSVDIHFD
jgi:hypothetical protein